MIKIKKNQVKVINKKLKFKVILNKIIKKILKLIILFKKKEIYLVNQMIKKNHKYPKFIEIQLIIQVIKIEMINNY